MAKFTEIDHVQNIETLCERLAILSDCSLDNRTYNNRERKKSQGSIFFWDTGASFELATFRSDFIDYVEADIPVKDVKNINRVIGIGTMLHRFQNDQGKDTFSPCVSYHLPTTDVRLLSPQTYHQMHGGNFRLSGDSVEMYYKGNIILITIRRDQANLPIVYNYFLSTQEKKYIGTHIWSAMAYSNISTLEFFGNIHT